MRSGAPARYAHLGSRPAACAAAGRGGADRAMTNPLFYAIAVLNPVVLAGLAGLNYFAFRLYRRQFFSLCALAWLLNALYIAMEKSSRTHDVPLIASILYVTIFAVALKDVAPTIRFSTPGVASIATAAVVGSIALRDKTLAFFLAATPTVIFSTVVLGALGVALSRRSDAQLLRLLRGETTDSSQAPSTFDPEASPFIREAHRPLLVARLAFAFGFVGYAAIQPLYLLRPWVRETGEFIVIFALAIALKMLNGIAVGALLLGDFRFGAALLRSRSIMEELGALTASIEHDIRIPVGVIRNYAAYLKAKYQHEPGVATKAKQIESELRRIFAAVEIIPAIRDGRMVFQRLNLVAITHAAIRASKTVHPNAIVEMATPRSILNIEGKHERLVQALVNIINNAIEASTHLDEARRNVIVTLGYGDTTHSLVVDDTGCGIDVSIRDKILVPGFSTKESDDRRNRGIGLYVASRILERHGASLNFESDGASFTRVTITFPAASVK